MPKTPRTELTPKQRFQQITAILAKAVIRCERRIRRSETSPAENSSANGLEVPGETRLSVSRCTQG